MILFSTNNYVDPHSANLWFFLYRFKRSRFHKKILDLAVHLQASCSFPYRLVRMYVFSIEYLALLLNNGDHLSFSNCNQSRGVSFFRFLLHLRNLFQDHYANF
ncbi:GSCOCG00007438001-RA-CDS [Cotesia congregata]|nr:GSCOCG00007438001-RA-CDS [Cotesia congregata]